MDECNVDRRYKSHKWRLTEAPRSVEQPGGIGTNLTEDGRLATSNSGKCHKHNDV